MFTRCSVGSSVLAGLIGLVAGASSAPAQAPTAFSYQGQLRESGAPKSGLFDMRFTLFDAATGGSAVSSVFSAPGVSVSGGIFSAMLDFGVAASVGSPGFFGSGPRFLQVEVSPAGAGTYVALSPRQQLTSVPSALAVGPLSAIGSTGADLSLNHSGGGAFQYAGSAVHQTFSVPSTCWLGNGIAGSGGYLGLLRIGGSTSASATFEILDDGQNVIATTGAMALDFSVSDVDYHGFQWLAPAQLLPGRVYTFRVTASPNLAIHVAPNIYPGGTLFVDGAPVADRDLAFYLSLKQSSMQLRSDAPLGLGTNPQAMLHVNGDAIIANRLGIGRDPQFALDVVGDSSLWGNVRIATNESDARFNLAGNGILAGFTGGGTALLRISAAPAAQSVRSAYLGYDSSQTAVLTLANQYGTGDINIKPAPGGRVGIGPGVGTTPNAGLEVTNDIAQATITTRGSNNWGTWFNMLGPTRNFAIANGGSFGQMWPGALGIRDLSAGVNRLVISPTGNVAIGDQYPSSSALFNVNADGPSEIAIGANNGASGGGTVLSLRTTGRAGGECQIQGISRAGFEYGTLVLNPQGGTVAKPGGGSFANYSDRTLKRDIEPLTGTLDRLLSLHGYSFRYTEEAITKKHALKGTQLGLMAQEVQSVFPDWVNTDSEGKLMVTERATTALMVEALRDLRTEKDAQIEAQKKEIESLRARLEAIEAHLRQR
ncbi:MAG: tail fiber domain-containing protein [Planctomycetes bacterium]|nr:tail fiber domain-containing protein [Planctomycetota bacterium]